MGFSRLSLSSATLNCLLFVVSQSTISSKAMDPLQTLPDEMLAMIQEYSPTELSFHASSSRLNRLLRRDAMLPLNREYSRRYIANEGCIRDEAICKRRNLRNQVRLNLGSDFKKYLIKADFRARVDALVETPAEQIWSDIQLLDLTDSDVHDIIALARLVNLKVLSLRYTRVQDISTLAGLVNLQMLYLSGTQVRDITAIGGLVKLWKLNLQDTLVEDITVLARLKNLQTLNLTRTHVQDISALAALENLRIYR